MNTTEDFVRDKHNQGALLNTNNSALATYKKRKRSFQKIEQISVLEDRIEKLEALVMALTKNV